MDSFDRFLLICYKLVPPFLAYAFTKHYPDGKRFQKSLIAIRFALQDLGITFVKLGQLLSARPDIVGLELASELRNLLDNEPVIPFEQIQEIIETETKLPVKKLFKKIEHTPIGTASVAQVHKAQLLSGAFVAIKVQRPHVGEVIAKDLPVLKKICQLLEMLTPHSSLQFTYLYNEFVDWITNELDFRVEGKRADTLRENMKSVAGVVIPHIYWQHTTKKVLVMSYLEGETLNTILNTMKQQHAATLYETKLPYKINPDRIIQRTVAAVAKQALVDKYFHGDMHPANIIIQKQNIVAFVDFGIIGTINAQEHMQILLTLVALVQNDPEMLTKIFKSLAMTPLSQEDVMKVHQQLSDELHKLHEDSSGKVSLNHFISVIFSLSQHYLLSFTQGFIIAMKTIAQIDSVAGQIRLQSSLITFIKPEVEKCVALSFSSQLTKENMSSTLINLFEVGKKLPQTLDELSDFIHQTDLARNQQTQIIKKGNSFLKNLFLGGIAILLAFFLVPLFHLSSFLTIMLLMVSPLLFFFVLATIFTSEGR